MLTNDPYSNGYGLRVPRGEVFSAIIRHMRNATDDINKEWKVLDIGCGLGANAKILDFFPNTIYVGVDLSQTAISKAKKSFQDSPYSIQFVCQDTLQFLRESSYVPDLVIDSASLQHHLNPSSHKSQIQFLEEFSKLVSSSKVFTQWASSTNVEMTKNFASFVGYEDIEEELRKFFTVTLYSIIEKTYPGRFSSEGVQMRIKEYIVILERITQKL